MKAFREHTGVAAPLDRPNIDTDQIIPKQFLKRIERSGYGEFLFFDWRYTTEGAPNPEFVLNQPRYRKASILIAERNFGCGSSREHAAWALSDYGFRVVISSSFADIFATNATKNGILPVTLGQEVVATLLDRARRQEGYSPKVSLVEKTVRDDAGFLARFEIDEFRRYCLLEGLDDIGLTLRHAEDIKTYEDKRAARGW
jgi:3-isopropylmalate/(R)-2-methylmalate dehydratase small subunit